MPSADGICFACVAHVCRVNWKVRKLCIKLKVKRNSVLFAVSLRKPCRESNCLFPEFSQQDKYIPGLQWKGRRNEKCTHAVLDPPIAVPWQRDGATNTYRLTHTQGRGPMQLTVASNGRGWISLEFLNVYTLKGFEFLLGQTKSETQTDGCILWSTLSSCTVDAWHSFGSQSISCKIKMELEDGNGRGKKRDIHSNFGSLPTLRDILFVKFGHNSASEYAAVGKSTKWPRLSRIMSHIAQRK